MSCFLAEYELAFEKYESTNTHANILKNHNQTKIKQAKLSDNSGKTKEVYKIEPAALKVTSVSHNSNVMGNKKQNSDALL